MDGRVNADSFAFPLHCQQVFFSDDPHRLGWKVVCRTDVRARRTTQREDDIMPEMLVVRNDDEFVALQPLAREADPIRRPREGVEELRDIRDDNVVSEDEG
jgi:hypothetical protein